MIKIIKMYSTSISSKMKHLVDGLVNDGIIKTELVNEVMRKVDRGDFCSYRPYEDSPQGINYNATISAPHMHAYCLVSLAILNLKTNIQNI